MIGPYFLGRIREELKEATFEDEAEILEMFAQGVERLLAAKETAPKLRIISGRAEEKP